MWNPVSIKYPVFSSVSLSLSLSFSLSLSRQCDRTYRRNDLIVLLLLSLLLLLVVVVVVVVVTHSTTAVIFMCNAINYLLLHSSFSAFLLIIFTRIVPL